MTSVQERKIRQTGCDARFDNLTRQLYSTDASIYQIQPVGAAFPKTAEQASLVIHATADAGLSITPRGAGTSLVGNALGDGLSRTDFVLDPTSQPVRAPPSAE